MEDGWGRELWAEVQGTADTSGPGPQLFLAGIPQKWNVRVGYQRPLTPAALACPQMRCVDKSVTSWEMLVSDHIDLFPFVSHRMV